MLLKIQEYWYLAAAGATLVVFLLLFYYWRNKKKQKKEAYEQRLKDEALNEALKNSLGKRNEFLKSQAVTPLEQYKKTKSEPDAKGLIVMKLEVMGKKKQSYVVSPEDHIFLGNEATVNDVILDDRNIAAKQCDIFLYDNHVYIHNLHSQNRMLLIRKGSRMELKEQSVQLITGDNIYVGHHRIQITLMDYMGNTILG